MDIKVRLRHPKKDFVARRHLPRVPCPCRSPYLPTHVLRRVQPGHNRQRSQTQTEVPELKLQRHHGITDRNHRPIMVRRLIEQTGMEGQTCLKGFLNVLVTPTATIGSLDDEITRRVPFATNTQ